MAGNVVKVRAKPVTAPSGGLISRPFFTVLVLIALALAAYVGYAFLKGKLGSLNAPLTEVEGSAGKIIKVPAGGDLQAAIDRAVGGDTIELTAGAVYKGVFQLRNKPGDQFITIRTSAPDTSLPPPDTRRCGRV